jgi:transcription antitermination factor NusG
MLDATVAVSLDAHNRDDIAACGSRWAVCQTHPQAERWALANLQRQGYAAHLPLTAAWRRDRATPTLRHRVLVPLWPGYLFVVPGSLWAPIRSTAGVSRLLMAGLKPHMLASGLVEALQAGEAVRATPLAGHSLIVSGEAVVVSKGAANGMVGAVISIHGDLARIGCMFFGQLREITIPIASLERRDLIQ